MLREWSDRVGKPRPILDRLAIIFTLIFGAAFFAAQVYFLIS